MDITSNAKLVRDAIASLDGKTFASKQEVEDAIFPMWAKLSIVFHGEGHRDLVDRLINARWLEPLGAGKGWKFYLPAPEKFVVPAAETPKPVLNFKVQEVSLPPKEEIEITLSIEDITLLNLIEKGEVTLPGQRLQNLINSGLVVQTFTLTDTGRQALIQTNTQILKFSMPKITLEK